MRACFAVSGVLLGIWIVASGGPARTEVPKVASGGPSCPALPRAASPSPGCAEAAPRYQMKMRIVQVAADGKEEPLCCPTLVAPEGVTGMCATGGQIPSPGGVDLREPLVSGQSYRVTVFRREGKVFVEASGTFSETSRSDADSVRLTTRGFRVVEAITLGKKITVPLAPDRKERFELTVDEFQEAD